MRFRINFEHIDGTEGHFDVTGDTLEQVRDIANRELFARTHNAISPVAWSEVLPEGTYNCPKCGLDYPHIHEQDGSVTRRTR